jgi:hypothetical protein
MAGRWVWCWACLGTALLVARPGRTEPPPAAPSYIDLRPALAAFGLTPRSQGARGTCSVFTMTAAMEYALAVARGHGQRLSPEFLNWASNEITGRHVDGSFFIHCWLGFQKFGLCADGLCPYRAAYDPRDRPSDAALADAKAALDPPLRLNWLKPQHKAGLSEEQVTRLRQVLASGWPICVGWDHSTLYVGYQADPDFPGWASFIRLNSALAAYDRITVEEASREVYEILYLDAPGATPPAPALAPPPEEQPARGAAVPLTVHGPGLAALWQIKGHAGHLHQLAFSADGRMLASSNRGASATKLWSAANGTLLAMLNGALTTAFTPDGSRLVAGRRGALTLHAPANGRVLGELEGEPGFIESLAAAPDRPELAAGSGEQAIWLWDLAQRRCRTVLPVPTVVSALGYAPDGRWLFSGGWDRVVRLWDLGQLKEVANIPDTAAAVFAADSRCLLVGRGEQFEARRLPDLQPLWSRPAGGPVTALAVSRDGAWLAVGRRDGRLRLYHGDDDAPAAEAELGQPVDLLAFGPDGERLAAGSASGWLTVLGRRP